MKLSLKVLLASIGLLVVAIIWGTGFVATKIALTGLTPLYFMAIRFIIAAMIMGLLSLKSIRKSTKETWAAGIVIGVCLYLGFAAQTIGLLDTTPGKQAFITGTNVVFVPFIAWLIFKQKPEMRSVLGALVCFAGIGLLSVDEQLRMGRGDLLTLVSAIFFAAQIVLTGWFAPKTDIRVLLVSQLTTVGVLSLVTAGLFEPQPVLVFGYALGATLYTALFGTCIAFFLQTIGQSYVSSSSTAMILSTEAVFGSVFSAMFFGETFTFKMAIGCFSILCAIVISEMKTSQVTLVQPE